MPLVDGEADPDPDPDGDPDGDGDRDGDKDPDGVGIADFEALVMVGTVTVMVETAIVIVETETTPLLADVTGTPDAEGGTKIMVKSIFCPKSTVSVREESTRDNASLFRSGT